MAAAAAPGSVGQMEPDDLEAVEFVRDESGVSVVVGGHPQSHVPDDPEFLAFEYIAHLAACLDLLLAPPPQRVAVTHVGGAGLTLARYLAHVRPGSPQIVLEPDAALTEAVRRAAPLPRGHRIRVRPTTGEEGILALRPASADAVVLDAFVGGRVPAAVTTLEFLTTAAQVLSPGGVFLANITDEPGLRYVARVAAGLSEAGLPHRALIATHDVLKGRRHGNVVLVGSATGIDTVELDRRLRRLPFPTGIRSDVGRWARGARPLTAADARPSPPAPDPGRWRVR